MAEKFCSKFGQGAHALKIGRSFEKKGDNSAYHSIRYDFKPVSVDEERQGQLEVQENKSVSVTLPHVDGRGVTNYKGNAKPANTKDCILIIDHETGELTLERISNQIMLKKTRPEKVGKSNESHSGLVLPSNPYQVKPEPSKHDKKEPENPYEVKKEPENPYEVKKEPENPYEVKKQPNKPKVSNSARPSTPQSMARSKKSSPSSPYNSIPALFKDTGDDHTTNTISPLHSNKSSPARPSPKIQQGYNIDSLGRVISESSDDSDSASSTGSDSDSDPDDPAPDKDCVLAAAMAAAEAVAPPSMPGDLIDLLSTGSTPFLPSGPGHLPTARPQKLHKSDRHREKDSTSTKQKTKPTPHAARPSPPPDGGSGPRGGKPPVTQKSGGGASAVRPPPPQEEGGGGSMLSMPSMFGNGDLGDDLELSSDSD